jgi:pyruvate/2-oxoglutarate dehydrogenase complex dihydrolipoamide dehydrogenase (E3) component
MNKRRAAAARIYYSALTKEFRTHDRSLVEGEKTGGIKVLLDESERPIGVQILGPHARRVDQRRMAVMKGRMGLSKVASSVHPYPPRWQRFKKGCDLILYRENIL